MWKRDEQQRPAAPSGPTTASMPQPSTAGPVAGTSMLVKGEISADEDLVLHGRLEGSVSLPGHVLTIGTHAQVSAEIVARTVIIDGSMIGNVRATERFEIRPGGRMNGDVTCPSVVMTEGSEFTGRVDMRRGFARTDGPPKEGERRREPSTV